MKPARPLLVLAAVGLILMPSSALAGGRGGVVVIAPHSSVVIASPSTVVVRTTPRIFVARTGGVSVTVTSPHRFFPHHFFPRFGTGVIVSSPFFPIVASAPPAIESSPPVVYAQPPTAPGGPRTVPPVQSRSSESSGKLYRWTDEQGVAHLTDRVNSIPERYRSEAQRWS